jgi:hypothetical protein
VIEEFFGFGFHLTEKVCRCMKNPIRENYAGVSKSATEKLCRCTFYQSSSCQRGESLFSTPR